MQDTGYEQHPSTPNPCSRTTTPQQKMWILRKDTRGQASACSKHSTIRILDSTRQESPHTIFAKSLLPQSWSHYPSAETFAR